MKALHAKELSEKSSISDLFISEIYNVIETSAKTSHYEVSLTLTDLKVDKYNFANKFLTDEALDLIQFKLELDGYKVTLEKSKENYIEISWK